MRSAGRMVAGVDVWLNTPRAAARGLRYERHEGRAQRRAESVACSMAGGWKAASRAYTGWAVGDGRDGSGAAADAAALYDKLEGRVLPLFYADKDGWLAVMRGAIA